MSVQDVSVVDTRSPFQLWMAAIKPPMYSVAVMPIWVGSATAFAVNHAWNSTLFALFLLSAILIVAWSNISNDVFDSETGIDIHKAHSLVNLTGNVKLIFWVGNLCLGLGVAGIGAISWIQQDGTVLALVLMCCAIGYVYQGPPFRWGYQGWGEPLCFLAYGPLAVAAAYYSQAQSWSIISLAASVVVGIATSLILFCSHFHQVQDDLDAGKRSPVVRLGTKKAAALLPWICGSIYGFTGLFVGVGLFPPLALLVLVSIPFAYQLTQLLRTYHHQPERIRQSKFIAVALHFWSGLLLGAAFIVAGWHS